ncbi:hypothetical protein QF035_000232 [Streptomyces umbrinus]|uniref:Rho termination factor N-terminal domain-containing protein n=1 Tax=Streptomyces umbrinus TaxID=67370 RepID=A0ABU0SGF3_9ACTN|nr:hypothetical protein [Streptomyces umbrinus]
METGERDIDAGHVVIAARWPAFAQRSGRPTYDQLYAQVKSCNIKGRSSMKKAELKQTLGK